LNLTCKYTDIDIFSILWQEERVYREKRRLGLVATMLCWRVLCRRNFSTTKQMKKPSNHLMMPFDLPCLGDSHGKCWVYIQGLQWFLSNSGIGVSLKDLSKAMLLLKKRLSSMALESSRYALIKDTEKIKKKIQTSNNKREKKFLT